MQRRTDIGDAAESEKPQEIPSVVFRFHLILPLAVGGNSRLFLARYRVDVSSPYLNAMRLSNRFYFHVICSRSDEKLDICGAASKLAQTEGGKTCPRKKFYTLESRMAQKNSASIRSSMVRFDSGIAAFWALPKAKTKRPAVILLHERYGVVQHTKDLTLKLAQAGYIGLAPDLFSRFQGDRKALTRGDVRVELRDDEVLKDLGEAIDYLKKRSAVDASRIGIVGVCQTGRHAVLLAAHRTDVSACVVFYGAAGGKEWGTDEFKQEPLEALIDNLSSPLLGIFGEADHVISIDDVLKFRGCLERSKKGYHIRIYRDAPHGWLNDTMPGRYRKEAARDAWGLMLAYLKKTFGGGWDRDRLHWAFESDISTSYDFTKNVRLE
ncbi:MAG: hypothetical protein A2038_08470 [Deltaproteobacteria bacterium GWA2_57_13]|nr:MAG: hypothetical protein A2038_08470 [Deltaproteobacteria bacterium GWA2_57_13]OGQ50638.1 MAG: hypothetical protein A3I10_02225 [Deltaproteobacteria bacterium RIFCSPLOWO2_02_FULL_57_26]OGQ77713.1 MAG: hypothetical protein A3G40_11620 [Deltaproteobacteria bacterium RIFCSPLOWO2_12_FULL_57_22]